MLGSELAQRLDEVPGFRWLLDPRLPQRFWDKVAVEPVTGCWLWRGNTTAPAPFGYGRISVDGRMTLAHRFAFESVVGPIPEGMEPDHLCHVRPCVNPAHLEIVTPSENQRRRRQAGTLEGWSCPQHGLAGVERLANNVPVCRTCQAEARAVREATVYACQVGHDPARMVNRRRVRSGREGWVHVCLDCERDRMAASRAGRVS